MVQKILNDQSIWLGRKGAGVGGWGELVGSLILGEWLQDVRGGWVGLGGRGGGGGHGL